MDKMRSWHTHKSGESIARQTLFEQKHIVYIYKCVRCVRSFIAIADAKLKYHAIHRMSSTWCMGTPECICCALNSTINMHINAIIEQTKNSYIIVFEYECAALPHKNQIHPHIMAHIYAFLILDYYSQSLHQSDWI